MKKEFKKILFNTLKYTAAALTLAGTVLIAGSNLTKASTGTYKDYNYSKINGKVTITAYKGKDSKIKIPSKIAGAKVTEIGPDAFYKNSKIKSVSMPDTVTVIRTGAFEDCTKLTTVKFSKNTRRIYNHAFLNCSSIKSIKLPAKITRLGASAFKDCTSLKTIRLSKNIKTIPWNCFSNCKSLSSFDFDNIEYIKSEAFTNCTSLSGDIQFKNLIKMDYDAFANCTSIKSVTFSKTLQRLGNRNFAPGRTINIDGEKSSNPFAGCTSLTSFSISPENVNYSVSDGILYGKSGKWLVAYPAGKIGEYTTPGSVVGIGCQAFQGSLATKITLSPSVLYVYREAFSNSEVRSVVIPDAQPDKKFNYYFHHNMFKNCTKLEEFIFPKGFNHTHFITFEGCTSLRYVYIPDGYTNLSNNMFLNCSALTEVVLPKSLNVIPANCFMNCTNLKTIDLSNITQIDDGAFCGCKSIYGKLSLPKTANIGCMAFADCVKITEVALAASTQSLGFTDNTELPVITRHYERVDYSYDILSAETYSNPFAGCVNLAKINFIDDNNAPAEGQHFTILDNCIYSLDKETLICVAGAKTGTLTIPYGVTTLAALAFNGSSLESINIPDSVKMIDLYSISDCKIKTLTIPKKVHTLVDGSDGLFPNCTELASITVRKGNRTYFSENGILFAKNDIKDLLVYPSAKKGKSFTTPKKCKIAGNAFSNCRYLKKLTIPSGSKINALGIIVNNCNGMKIYLPADIKELRYELEYDNGKMYTVATPSVKKCTIYIKKNSTIHQKIKKGRYSFTNYKTYK